MSAQTEPKPKLEQFTVLERAIIYARVSTDEQAESGTSIDNQVEKSQAYAAANNLQVVATFREDYTGKVLDRPELNKVRDMLRAGLADNLIVYKTNRLDRSEWGVNLLILLQELKALGVSLHYSQDRRRIDLTNPVEALMQSISGWQAGEDHRETVTKLHEGRIKRAKDGYVVPNGKNAPYGYKKVKIDKRWYFEIVEEEARIVRMIFQWYVYGDETGKVLSLQKVAERLNQAGISKRAKPEWTYRSVHHIIINEVYAGVWYYGKRNRDNRTHSAEAIPVAIPAIIEREVWEAAQEQIQENKTYSERNRRPGRYLFASRVTCGECHYKMIGQSKYGNRYLYYRCPCSMGKGLRKTECHLPSFRADMVDQRAWDKLEEASRDKKQLIEGLQGWQARQESKIEPIKRELTYVEQLIVDKTAEWEDDYASMRFLPELAKAKKGIEMANTEKVLGELKKRKSELLAELEKKSITDEQIIGTVEFAAQVAEAMATIREAEARGVDMPELKAAVFEGKRRLLEMLDVQITLFIEDGRKKGRLTAKYCPLGEVFSVVSVDIYSNEPANGLTSQKKWCDA